MSWGLGWSRLGGGFSQYVLDVRSTNHKVKRYFST